MPTAPQSLGCTGWGRAGRRDTLHRGLSSKKQDAALAPPLLLAVLTQLLHCGNLTSCRHRLLAGPAPDGRGLCLARDPGSVSLTGQETNRQTQYMAKVTPLARGRTRNGPWSGLQVPTCSSAHRPQEVQESRGRVLSGPQRLRRERKTPFHAYPRLLRRAGLDTAQGSRPLWDSRTGPVAQSKGGCPRTP